ncbi:MAG: aminotransferase class V-fold PLP-dependent enzyme [Gemmatimonadetes bacterium]|nr:aminotransferase class V-fold PLP-dependent enzyme [Gemmatimonadota bacterium]
MNKREFLRTMGGVSAGLVFGPELLAQYASVPPVELAEDEAFWAAVRAKFRLDPQYINLENGYYCFQPEPVLEGFFSHVRRINYMGSRYMRTVKNDEKLRVRTKLAAMAGCSPAELIITRNTTESLDTVIAGFDWKPGDEAVMANQDYGAMLDQFRLMARRHGMVNRFVDVPLHPASDDDVVQVYANAITPKTRLLMVCHMINITGHVLPVRKICDMAHARGMQVMVDGAHAFAHLDFKIPDLDCDYYGASLHKWLSVPLGAGILYVKKERIAGLWPVYGDPAPDDDISKLNHTGTHPCHTDLGIEDAIVFHEAIGGARKEARLRYLQRYWSDQVRGQPRIVLNTPAEPGRSCGIANVGVAGVTPADLMKTLFEKHRIWTVAINGAGVHGVRVTPQVYTITAELDAFVKALRAIAA